MNTCRDSGLQVAFEKFSPKSSRKRNLLRLGQEHWLGLEAIYQITNRVPYILRQISRIC